MTKIAAVPKPDVPTFLDETVVQIQDALKANISWLDHSFGRSQKLIDKDTKRAYPAVHIGYEKYINIFPDQELGNFSFLKMNDPGVVGKDVRQLGKYKTKFSLIFWMDLDSIFGDEKDRSSEAIKLQILNFLSKGLFLTKARLSISEVYEEAENIYKGYDIKEIDSQFLMQPYYGLRFDGEITINKFCEKNIGFLNDVPTTYTSMVDISEQFSTQNTDIAALQSSEAVQNTDIAALQSSEVNHETRITVLENLENNTNNDTPTTTSTPVYFAVRNSGATNQTINNASFVTMRTCFDDITDSGSNYSNGEFTVPENGFYSFNGGFVFSLPTGEFNLIMSLYVDGTRITLLGRNRGGGGFFGVSGASSIYCTAGQVISVRAYQNSGSSRSFVDSSGYQWFSGFKVS